MSSYMKYRPTSKALVEAEGDIQVLTSEVVSTISSLPLLSFGTISAIVLMSPYSQH